MIGYRGAYFGPDGKRRYVSGETKRRHARRSYGRHMADGMAGFVFDAGNLKVEEYLDRWLTDSVRDTVRPRTFERYEQITRKHICCPGSVA